MGNFDLLCFNDVVVIRFKQKALSDKIQLAKNIFVLRIGVFTVFFNDVFGFACWGAKIWDSQPCSYRVFRGDSLIRKTEKSGNLGSYNI